jgi:hypothetical protein
LRRFINVSEARARHAERTDRLGDCLSIGDPLADAVVDALAQLSKDERARLIDTALDRGLEALNDAPPALAALFESLDRVPFWVDFERANRGGNAFLRSGWFGGVVLALESLILGYCSPAGNKPLAFSGRLRESAPRRLAETSRFVQAVSLPGGMRRFGDGFKITVKVRLMHAQLRRMLCGSPDWASSEWGVPINQADMAGTILLFSLLLADGLAKLGVGLDDAAAEDLMHLWRYVGYVIGVEHDLLCASLAEGRVLWDVLGATQDVPDHDARELAAAVIATSAAKATSKKEHERILAFGYGVSRYLLGDSLADALGYPNNGWKIALPALRPVLRVAHVAAQRTNLGRTFAAKVGVRHWSTVVDTGLAGTPATFALPVTLAAE